MSASHRFGVPCMQLSEADNIKVAVRVRPLFNNDTEKGAQSVLQVMEDHTTVQVCVHATMPSHPDSKKCKCCDDHMTWHQVSCTAAMHMTCAPQFCTAYEYTLSMAER